ncbi:hypothetical protein RI054_05g25880 [Pseudoscourfieldia marina]
MACMSTNVRTLRAAPKCRVRAYAPANPPKASGAANLNATIVRAHQGGTSAVAAVAAAWALSCALAFPAAAIAADDDAPPPPPIGDCTDCVGIIEGTLNTCTLNTASCVSTQSDDEEHFVAPYEWSGNSRELAMRRLVEEAPTIALPSRRSRPPLNVRRTDALQFIVGAVRAFVTGGNLPQKPMRSVVDDDTSAGAFHGHVEAFDEEAGYVRISFQPDYGRGDIVYDGEFSFLPADTVVALRCAARNDAPLDDARVSLTVESGLALQRNGARILLDDLRVALGWDVAPVITTWDKRYNDDSMWFEGGFDAVGFGRRR